MIIIQFVYGSLTSRSFKYKLYNLQEKDMMPENKIKRVHTHTHMHIQRIKIFYVHYQTRPNTI